MYRHEPSIEIMASGADGTRHARIASIAMLDNISPAFAAASGSTSGSGGGEEIPPESRWAKPIIEAQKRAAEAEADPDHRTRGKFGQRHI